MINYDLVVLTCRIITLRLSGLEVDALYFLHRTYYDVFETILGVIMIHTSLTLSLYTVLTIVL